MKYPSITSKIGYTVNIKYHISKLNRSQYSIDFVQWQEPINNCRRSGASLFFCNYTYTHRNTNFLGLFNIQLNANYYIRDAYVTKKFKIFDGKHSEMLNDLDRFFVTLRKITMVPHKKINWWMTCLSDNEMFTLII